MMFSRFRWGDSEFDGESRRQGLSLRHRSEEAACLPGDKKGAGIAELKRGNSKHRRAESQESAMRAKRFWAIAKASPPVLALVICVVVWLCRQPPEAMRARWLTRHGYIEVPVQVSETGAFEIVARCNGKPLRLYVDTGSNYDSLYADAIERLDLRLEPIPGFRLYGFRRDWEIRSKVIVNDFAAGDWKGRWQAIVKDESRPYQHDGILGSRYMASNDAVIDYGSKKMFFREEHLPDDNKLPDQPRESPSALLKRQGYLEVPLYFAEGNKKPQVAATIEGEPIFLFVDTGAESNTLAPSVAERLHLPKSGTTQFFGRPLYRTHATAFSLGGTTEVLEALLLDFPKSADGVLDHRYLLTHAAVIDYGSKKLYLRTH